MTEPTQNGSAGGQHEGARRRGMDVEALARGLGWLSVGLGVAQVAAPHALGRALGVAPSRRRAAVTRALGARELAIGIGLLTHWRPGDLIWARALGHAVDLALLGSSLRGRRVRRGRLVAATASVAALTILDTLAGAEVGLVGPRADVLEGEGRTERVTGVITIGRPPAEVYRFFRDLRNAPRFMGGIQSVERVDDRRSRWTADLPGGATASWEAEIVDDRPGEGFSFRALGETATALSGAVRFTRAPGDRGAEVRLTLTAPKGGAIAAAFARMFGPALELKAEADLRRLKQLIEIGEVVRSDASIHRGPHPARPAEGARRARAEEARAEEAGEGPLLVVERGAR